MYFNKTQIGIVNLVKNHSRPHVIIHIFKANVFQRQAINVPCVNAIGGECSKCVWFRITRFKFWYFACSLFGCAVTLKI